MAYVQKVLKENVKPSSEADRHECFGVDKQYFDKLPDDTKPTYHTSYVPNEQGNYDFVATHEEINVN